VGDLGYAPASIRSGTPPEFCNTYAADININNIATLTLQDVTYSLTLYECIPSATLEAAIGTVTHGIFEQPVSYDRNTSVVIHQTVDKKGVFFASEFFCPFNAL
jgi:hypothetical protein